MTGIDRVFRCVSVAPATCRDVAVEVFGDGSLRNMRKASAYLSTLQKRGKVKIFGQVEAIHFYGGHERGGRLMNIYEAVA